MSTVMRAVLALSSITLLSVASAVFAAQDDYSRNIIKQRIAPVGDIKMVGEDTPTAEADKQQVVAEQKKDTIASVGEATYKKSCVACHASGVAGAPKFRDKSAWQDRQEKGIKTLVQSVVNGLGAMPPKGTCMDCTTEQIKQAVEYMLPQKS